MPTVILTIILLLSPCLFAENYPKQFEGSFEHWEQQQLDLLSIFLPENPVILQAGAHYGKEAARFAIQWPNSQILCFEPNPHALEIFHENTASFLNIKAYPYALNDHSGKEPFYVCHGTYGKDNAFEHASSLLKASECMEIHYQGPLIDVNTIVLDDWCRENQIDHIDLINLDLNGSELQVLKSSPKVLKNLKGICVHTHSFPFRIGTTMYTELRKFLEDAGFILLAHWHREGLDGKAIFIKRDFYFNSTVDEYLKNNHITSDYKRYFEPYFKVYYDLDDRTDSLKEILKQGYAYEGNIGILIDQLTKPSTLALDIGTHVGVHTITMSRKVGPNGAVIAFEPNLQLYMELLHTLSLNHCTNVVSISKALADRPQTLRLSEIHIVQDDLEEGYPVETITLDSLNLNNVSIIKMDVECYEYYVLKGAEKTILRNKPVIIFECWIGQDYEKSGPKQKANFDRVMSLIESYGYEVYVIYNNDFIAFPKDTGDDWTEYKSKFDKLIIPIPKMTQKLADSRPA